MRWGELTKEEGLDDRQTDTMMMFFSAPWKASTVETAGIVPRLERSSRIWYTCTAELAQGHHLDLELRVP
jgi:hypothetical protein